MENFDLRKYLAENQLTSEENLEEGWKQNVVGGGLVLATLVGGGTAYVAPKVGDSITSTDQNRDAVETYNKALLGMSIRDPKGLGDLYKTIENSKFKDKLKPSQAHYTSQGDSASLASSRLQEEVDALTQVIKAHMDHFAIMEKTGTVLFIKDPVSLQALEAGEKIRPVNYIFPELKEEKSKLKMKKSQLKEMIKTAFMNEAGPAIDTTMASLRDTTPNDAFGDKDDLNLPNFVKTKVAADVKNAADVAEKMLEFLATIEQGEKIPYSERSLFIPIVKLLTQMAKSSLPNKDEDPFGMEDDVTLDEMLAQIMQEGDDEIVDPYLAEAEEEEDVKVKVKTDDLEDEVDVDAGEEIDLEDTDVEVDAEEAPAKNDSIVIDKKIVSLSSLPGETRKILDTLETLRAQAEEFGDQKFITQVGNTITFFTRDFVVAGDAPNPAGIEERDGELDVNIDSEKSTAEMEAGLGLEESTFPMWNKIK